MRAVGQLAGRISPCSAAGGGRRPEQRRAVIYLHRAAGRRRSGESWCVVVGDAVAHVPLSVENEAMVGAPPDAWVLTVTASAADAALVFPAASIAFAVRLWAPSAKAAVV